MGIHYWSKSAVLILALATFQTAHSATQVSTPTSTFTNIMNAAQKAVGLPYGDAAFFGPEFTAEHTAGSRFQAGQSLPSSGATGQKVKVAIKPVVTINPAKVAKSAVSVIRGGNVPAILASAAVGWAIDQIPGASVNPTTGELTVTDLNGSPLTGTPESTTVIGWNVSGYSTAHRRYNPKDACQAAYPIGTYVMHQNSNPPTQMQVASYVISGSGETSVSCFLMPSNTAFGAMQTVTVLRSGTTCPAGSAYSTQARSCVAQGAARPFADAEYQSLEDAIARVTNSDWLRDLTKAKCAGSLSPEACYRDLVDRRPNHGPSSQTTPPVSTTTTKTNPDGTSTTTTTTVHNKYDYTYTENDFTYRTTTTTTTTTDGKTTTEVVADTTDPNTPPLKEPQSEDQEEPIEFTDSEFPQVTPFYEQKYPDGLSGVWNQVSADIGNSAFIGFLKSFVPTFTGTCPTFGLSFNIASWANYGSISFWNMCWIFDFIKMILLVTAVFTARALTFGG